MMDTNNATLLNLQTQIQQLHSRCIVMHQSVDRLTALMEEHIINKKKESPPIYIESPYHQNTTCHHDDSTQTRNPDTIQHGVTTMDDVVTPLADCMITKRSVL